MNSKMLQLEVFPIYERATYVKQNCHINSNPEGNQLHNLVVFCYQLCSLCIFGRITTLKWYDICNLQRAAKKEGIG
jgi:hypothetical protein